MSARRISQAAHRYVLTTWAAMFVAVTLGIVWMLTITLAMVRVYITDNTILMIFFAQQM